MQGGTTKTPTMQWLIIKKEVEMAKGKVCKSKTCDHKGAQPIEKFGISVNSSDGYNNRCRKCLSKYMRDRGKRNKEQNTNTLCESPRLKKRDKSKLHTTVDWDKVMSSNVYVG